MNVPNRNESQLREDALAIWNAGVDAVRPAHLIPQWVEVVGETLLVGDLELSLADVERIAVIGFGKASAGMAAALEGVLGPQIAAAKQLGGWVNLPADCLLPTKWIHLHPARPAGVNEPTEEAVAGTREILNLVESLGPRDLCICLTSGGGSALLPMPIDGFSLADKIEITRELSASGATIQQINTVRRELSEVKGGGLLHACGAGQMISLILSDVLGDDLKTIASGPTVRCEPKPESAIATLEELGLAKSPLGQRAITAIRNQPRHVEQSKQCEVVNLVIGNNATAVDAAGVKAEQLGYSHAMTSAREPEGHAEEVGMHLGEMARTMRDSTGSNSTDPNSTGPDCLISGGEPVVKLVSEVVRGRGGRNQQLCLAALNKLEDWHGVSLISGGTDGEDGPTDAAGAIVTAGIVAKAKELELAPADYLLRNDAYTFFEQVGGLVKTGPTNTNVCDLRVVTVNQGR
ncbi:glycerate kinase type-2 family protein [Adhaeretor mobilis]|uniref:Hydroxypyruvate reductase n=1 Tax=Adhaeretor mobilis TaxID=1930276 RepID=A0A517MSZ0_9BACT|nr:DUF4147 domain-containing protein [Adhaeretor mobilis]QDS98000.1 Putative hydroxypyruvate reductase [Adhaeretor mobilis]